MRTKYNLAVVGTNFIVPKFIDAAERSGYFSLYAIMSRKIQSGVRFRDANHHGQNVAVHDNMRDLLADDKVDVVYLASPNAMHYPQARACVNAGKTVIVEKPITSNTEELQSLIALASEKGVLLMDGMKSLVCPNFTALVQNIPKVGRIRQCTSTFSKVSSRYQDYLDGNNPNTFNRMLSNGSAMDLGVYCLYPFVRLFGSPDRVYAFADLLDSGVDAAGTVILTYRDFHVCITHSKVCATTNSSEIKGEQGTIVIDNISSITGLNFVDKAGCVSDISTQQDSNSLLYIAQHLGETMISGVMESSVNTHTLSKKVMSILDEIRLQTGVIFPADKV